MVKFTLLEKMNLVQWSDMMRQETPGLLLSLLQQKVDVSQVSLACKDFCTWLVERKEMKNLVVCIDLDT